MTSSSSKTTSLDLRERYLARVRDPLALLEHLAVAHEIHRSDRHLLRNKLSAIRNASYYNKRRVEGTALANDDPRVGQFFRLIEEEIAAVTELIDQGPSARGLRKSETAPWQAAQCARDAVRFARLGTDATIAVELEEEKAVVDVDPMELTLALRALVENAAEAMPGGGRVRIVCARRAGEVVIEISDEGPGFHDVGAALRPLHSTKPDHLGLGLNIARTIATRFGGELALSEGGSTGSVTVKLPDAEQGSAS